MNRLSFSILIFITSLVFFSFVSFAFAEEYTVEITDTGFHPTNSTIYHTDHLRFVSNSTSDWIINSEPLLGGQHVIRSEGTTWLGFNSGNYTVTLHKNYGDDLGLTPFTLEIKEPQPEVVEVIPTNSTSTEIIIVEEETPIVEETPTVENPPENTCGFTGWQQEGNRNVAYRCGEEVASYIIENPTDNFVGDRMSEQNQTLDLRLQILKVLESIFSILFG